ncbi:hypothetical protein NWFMUON74_37230 [Nocardia wallacei]|uniref:DNA mismatch repair proteins mutS family domain-containing protein n=1 Tax=Nocardia wallacei TaxID=480035 RepID=A0A7G1KM96_9NOCA|nr:hypothetical protein NWFMUON74_37230 [Nocardia wallacei]
MAEFRSILWRGGDETYAVDTAPHVRTDLNLDQIFTATGASAHEAVYCRTLEELDGALAALPSRSNGLRDWLHDHVGAAPYRELAAGQHPRAFRRLEQHAERHRDFIAPAVARFDAELRFYLDYLRFVRELAEHGTPFCYPEVTTEFADIHAEDTYDAAPAVRLAGKSGTVVRNDFRLPGRERIIVVTGPDQGGKSTFARAFGQLFHLAALGCPVPGTRARAPLPDALFTQFRPRRRHQRSGRRTGAGTAADARHHGCRHPAQHRFLNESFSTTAAADALRIGGDVVRRIVDRGAAALYVTFLDELAEPGPEVMSMVAGATDNVQDFFRYLRTELAFYLGCLNLRERLGRTRTPICYPVPVPGTPTLRCDDLRDAALCLASDRVVGNDVDAAGVTFFVVSGANSGGKSTFLRSVGTARLMMQAGMFVTASAFTADLRNGVFTHFVRAEDPDMEHGRLDEELTRMREVTEVLRPGGMLLCNEPFASTDDREAAAIADPIMSALLDSGAKVVLATHLYDSSGSGTPAGGTPICSCGPSALPTAGAPIGWPRAPPRPPATARTSTPGRSGSGSPAARRGADRRRSGHLAIHLLERAGDVQIGDALAVGAGQLLHLPVVPVENLSRHRRAAALGEMTGEVDQQVAGEQRVCRAAQSVECDHVLIGDGDQHPVGRRADLAGDQVGHDGDLRRDERRFTFQHIDDDIVAFQPVSMIDRLGRGIGRGEGPQLLGIPAAHGGLAGARLGAGGVQE